MIENGGCNVEVQDVKNKKLNEQMLLSTFDPTTHKNTIKANRNDEKHKFLFTPNNEEEDKKNSEKEILEDPTKIPALNEIIPKNI